jgi:GT2 family glycosyltransferase
VIGIVILTHERVHLLRRCVEDVLGRTSDLTTEIVIWNNGSRDGTREYLDSLDDPRLRIVHHPENIGQNGYAEGFALLTTDYLVELDDDMIEAPHEWDRRLLEAFRALPRIGFLAADLEDDEHDYAANVRYRERPHLYAVRESAGIRVLDGPTGGGCAMTSREAYDAVGGFRQSKRHIFWEEETAYIADLRGHGYEATTLADLKLRHAGGPYYSKQSEAKHEYWSHYWKRQWRKDRVKRVLLRIPLVAPLNARFEWFQAPDAIEPARW